MEKWIPVVEAAMQIGVSRERLLRLVTIGAVQGKKDAWGRWQIEQHSLAKAGRDYGAVTTNPGNEP